MRNACTMQSCVHVSRCEEQAHLAGDRALRALQLRQAAEGLHGVNDVDVLRGHRQLRDGLLHGVCGGAAREVEGLRALRVVPQEVLREAVQHPRVRDRRRGCASAFLHVEGRAALGQSVAAGIEPDQHCLQAEPLWQALTVARKEQQEGCHRQGAPQEQPLPACTARLLCMLHAVKEAGMCGSCVVRLQAQRQGAGSALPGARRTGRLSQGRTDCEKKEAGAGFWAQNSAVPAAESAHRGSA